MNDLKLDIAFWNYDRTRALADGTVKIAGVNASFHTARIVPEIFEQMIRHRAFDVSELGMTYFLRAMEVDPEFLAIPVFPNRAFRHSAIYVNKASGIQHPEDLAGKTIGELALYGHDAGVMPKGMLSDDYGVTPNQCRWIVGGIDFPMKPIDFVPQPHPADVEVSWAAPDDDLGKMLEAGEIDALISADIPDACCKGRLRSGACSKTMRRPSVSTTGALASSRSCTRWWSASSWPTSIQRSSRPSTGASAPPRMPPWSSS